MFPERTPSLFFFPDPLSHDLMHEIAQLLCGLFLLLSGGMGVGAEGEPGIVVTKHGGNGLYVYTVL